jgi:hypothetical protein
MATGPDHQASRAAVSRVQDNISQALMCGIRSEAYLPFLQQAAIELNQAIAAATAAPDQETQAAARTRRRAAGGRIVMPAASR